MALTSIVRDRLRAIRYLELQQIELELLILQTPSGETRNALADANIHLMESIRLLKEIKP